MSDDVLIIGGGIEGYLAALSALETDPSATVRVLVVQENRFDGETGLIDLLGYEPDGSGPVENPLAAIDRLPETHRYSRLGLDTVEAALETFDEVTDGRYVGQESERNALFPTAVGRLAPATRYPRAVEAGVVSHEQPMRLVGFERVADFHAELAASRLDEVTPYDVSGDTIETPFSVEEAPPAVEIADRLDANELTEGRSARYALATRLFPELDVEPRIGLPAVLGETETTAIRETLESQLHAAVFEIPLGPPSLPGRRLESLLATALETRGGRIERDVSVTGFEWGDGQVGRISVRQGGEPDTFEAESYVLATGGAGDGGLEGGPEGVSEPVFDCPVAVPGDSFVDEQFLGDHPAVRAGVETDGELRPVDSQGSPLYANLYAAGRVLESPNVVAEHAASGFSLVTGFAAGKYATD